jgi:exopolyphosphatase/guanosine-5'-triphosphate,3'-diphosphate pyrophosphatase
LIPGAARSGDPPPRIAVVDLGTNTALMSVLVAAGRDPRRLRIVEDLHVVTGLGRDRGADGRLAARGRQRAMQALRHFAARLDALVLDETMVRGAATAAVREAADGEEFLEEIRELTGLHIGMVDGREEAELVALAQERSFPQRLPLLVVDIGGGSTEVALRHRGRTEWEISLPLGSVKLGERHGSGSGGEAELAALREAVQQACGELPVERERATLVGVAGTVTTAFQVARGLAIWDPERIHGQTMRATELDAVASRLAGMSDAERRRVPGLHPGRARFIVPGILLLRGIMEHYAMDEVLVSDRGLRFGLLFRDWPRVVVE